jgi:hypothetical protein
MKCGSAAAVASANARTVSATAASSPVEVTMDLMRHRPYLRALTRQQRRKWFEQRKRLTARVVIGTAWLPMPVRRSYAYAQRF